MSSVRKSLLLSLVDSHLGLLLQLAATAIISRLLTPTQVGVFAIAAVFSALASTVRDFGVGEYLIQERSPTPEKIRAALALNIIISWGMALVLAALAPFAADFYREEGVGDVMVVLALNFLLVPFGAVTHAWLRRELNYGPIVICNLISRVASFTAAVSLALFGFGYMSLAWSSFVGIFASVVAVSWFRPENFPVLPSLKGVRQIYDFGKFASGIYIVGQLGKGAPELLIGRVRDAADVGYFSRAGGLIEIVSRLLTRPVMQICMPFFARANREGGSVGPAYLQSVSLLTAVGWPVLGFLSLSSYAAIRIVYGPQWLSVVPLAQLLCIACAVELLFVPSREALLACGEARRAHSLQLQIVALQVIGLLAVVPFGLAGACWGLIAASLGGVLLSQRQLSQHLGVTLGQLIQACRPSIALTAAAMAPVITMAILWPIDESNYVRWSILGGAAATLLWLVGVYALRHPLWVELLKLTTWLFRRA